MNAQQMFDLREGRAQAEFDARYVVYGEIASGALASVRYGRLFGEDGSTREVAIKRLHPQFASEQDFVATLLAEARSAARLLHANIVHTLDVIELPGEVALVMEYVHGESLATLLRLSRAQSKPIPIPVACGIIASILHGLHAAHEARSDAGKSLEIVHRNVSPQTLIVGVDGVARVRDFGIAKAATQLGSAPARKPGYSASELLQGKKVDRRTDVYGAAAVLWELLTGVALFEGVREPELTRRALYEPVTAPSSRRRGVRAKIDAIVLRGLQRDPGARFPTALDMALAIERAIRVATPAEIAAWLQGLAGKRLSVRAQTLEHLQTRGARRPQLPEISGGAGRLVPAARPTAAQQVTIVTPRRAADPAARPKLARFVWVLSAVAAVSSIALLSTSSEDPKATTPPAPQLTAAGAEPEKPEPAAEAPAVPPMPALPPLLPPASEAAAPESTLEHPGDPSAKAARPQPEAAQGDPCALYSYVERERIRGPGPECL